MRPALSRNTRMNRLDLSYFFDAQIITTDLNPSEAINTGKIMAKAWAESLADKDQIARHTFIYRVIESYWKNIHATHPRALPPTFSKVRLIKLDAVALVVAKAIGGAAARLNVIEASFQLGNLYTAVLPDSMRSSNGIFYTPPALTGRLIEISENAGVNWATARIVDPACGGGAFLAPVVLKMVEALKGKQAREVIEHIENHLRGYEIDPFGAWLSQVFLEVALREILNKAGVRIKPLVRVCDSLTLIDSKESMQFDLVIGNPPYGKISLNEITRHKYKESLYGHANLYGLFTHLALHIVGENGVIGFLTPTSFLSGEYFKNLRTLIRKKSMPVETDFVSFRKGVFEGVLQETMLAVYKKNSSEKTIRVNQITTLPENKLKITKVGNFQLSSDLAAPWILPRTTEQSEVVQVLANMYDSLTTWGYKISTGPLVWNRHKKQLTDEHIASVSYPVIWSESILQKGAFALRAEKRNHQKYFRFQEGDDWLITKKECILLQRTTAKEQEKRLVAALLPRQLVKRHRGVIVENHLNMIVPVVKNPIVQMDVLCTLLNSRAANEAFRTISGSVAVSAYELESLPLPRPEKLRRLAELVARDSADDIIERECYKIFQGD